MEKNKKKYSESHEWIDPSTGEVGITAHALGLLGEIVFLELPEKGDTLSARNSVAVIESHKAASDIYAPVDGTVSSINQEALDAPEDIATDQDIWLFTLSDTNQTQIDGLMDKEAYEALIAE